MQWPPWKTHQVPRFAYRFRRTLQYLFHLLVWSRVFAARRDWGRVTIPEALRLRKGVRFAQPSLEVSGRAGLEHLSPGFRAIYDILFANLKRADAVTPFRHAVPGPAFAGVYLWDSAFIARIWQYWDRASAREILQSVIALRDGDRLQHVVADFVTSGYTQPSLIAWSADRLLHGEPDQNLARTYTKQIYPPLVAFHEWLNRQRRREDGLYFWIHPYESGVENAPRFASADERILADTRKVAAPDACTYVILQCEALAALAMRLDQTDEAKTFHERANGLRASMNDRLWDEADGLYYDARPDGSLVRTRTIASLLPLAAGVPDAKRAARLLESIRDPASFGSTMPLPSVALCDPAFSRDMWRGPVWLNVAYMVVLGLVRYHFLHDAAEVAWRLCDGVFRVLEAEHQVYEFYDPEHFHTRLLCRKKGNLWKAITLGTGPQKEFVGWTGLVNTLIIEVLLGYHRGPDGITLRPCLPSHLLGVTLRLELPEDGVQLEITGEAEQASRGWIVTRGGRQAFALPFAGETRFTLPE